MHRTEGDNNSNNLFTDGPPGTTVEERWLNSVQEEIANVIEDAGITLQTAPTDSSRNQLIEAINLLISAGQATDLYNNVIINPDGGVAQRGASGTASFTAATAPANNDDTYLIDRWNLLSDGNDIVDVSQSTDAPSGSTFSQKFLVATANKKWGMVQFVENKDSIPFDGKRVSLSFAAKTTTAAVVRNIRAAVLSWDGAADTVTSDIISAWNAEGANPTLVANWTYENTASDLSLTTSWQTFTIENIGVDTSGMTNMAVFIWVDDADASVNDELFISQVKLNQGSTAITFRPRQIESEVALCQRFYQKSYNQTTVPGVLTAVGSERLQITNVANSDHSIVNTSTFKCEMRTTPTVTIYDEAGNSGNVTMITGNGILSSTSGECTHSFRVISGLAGAPSATRLLGYLWTADAEL